MMFLYHAKVKIIYMQKKYIILPVGGINLS